VSDEPMTLIERLRNPQWAINCDNSQKWLDEKYTLKDMAEAADRIEYLERTLIKFGIMPDKPKPPPIAPDDHIHRDHHSRLNKLEERVAKLEDAFKGLNRPSVFEEIFGKAPPWAMK
jgi:hypothetical protein